MIKKLFLPALLVLGSAASFGFDREPHPFVSRIERLDPALDAVLASGCEDRKTRRGVSLDRRAKLVRRKESRRQGTSFRAIVFSDVLANTSYRWQEGWNHAEVFLRPSGLLTNTPGFRERGSNGMTRDTKGNLIICQHGERRVVRFEAGFVHASSPTNLKASDSTAPMTSA